MQLLIIRHGHAEERADFAKLCSDDALRPLTSDGRKDVKKVAKGLRQLCPTIDVLASSPFTRAIETAEVIAEVFGDLKIIQRPELVPNKRRDLLLRWLQSQKSKATVAIVGHEPHLSAVASWLMTGLGDAIIELKKGAVCLLEFDGEIAPGRARMKWLMTARLLKRQR